MPIDTFSASGIFNWTGPSSVFGPARVRCFGGGGGGSPSTFAVSQGGGGGGGGFGSVLFDVVTDGEYVVLVGGGGSGNGGRSSFTFFGVTLAEGLGGSRGIGVSGGLGGFGAGDIVWSGGTGGSGSTIPVGSGAGGGGSVGGALVGVGNHGRDGQKGLLGAGGPGGEGPTFGFGTGGSGGYTSGGGSGLFAGGGGGGCSSAPSFIPGGSGAPGMVSIEYTLASVASGLMTMFTMGSLDSSSGCTFFIEGQAQQNTIPLYEQGYVNQESGCTLFLDSSGLATGVTPLYTMSTGEGSGQKTLFLNAIGASSGSSTLYIAGHSVVSRGMNLFAKADTVPSGSSSFSLFAHGSTASGFAGGVGLHTYSDVSGQNQQRMMVLSLRGADQSVTTRNVNLWVQGRTHLGENTTTLFAKNEQSGVDTSATLHIRGSGVGDGYYLDERAMSLVMWRDPTNAISLYIQGPGEPAATGVGLFAHGSQGPMSQTMLVVPDVIGYKAATLKLYTHGY